MLNYTGTTYGYLTIKQGKDRFKIDIREANCLCAFIYVRKATKEELKKNPEGKYYHSLYSFLANDQHARNIMKDNNGKLFWDEVVNITLNLAYDQSFKLLKLFTKAGYQVTCHYTKETK